METKNSSLQKQNDLEDFYEPLTSGGCPRSRHVELTLGIGKFESRVCPVCKQEVYRP